MGPSESNYVSGRKGLTFADLPKELRDLIWSFAIPSYYAEPQAQFFGLIADEANDGVTIQWESNPWGAHIEPPWVLCPPDVHQDGLQSMDDYDWASKGNHSAYLAVSSLWHACSASREVLRRQFERHYKKQMGKSIRGAEDTQMVTFISAKDPARRCIKTRPGVDLMHISTDSLHNVFASGMPFRHYFNSSSFSCTEDGLGIPVQHFGVDYDRNWAEQLAHLQEELEESTSYRGGHQERWDAYPNEPTALHGVIAIAGRWWTTWDNRVMPGTLWLVDYDLQPISSVEEREETADALGLSTNRQAFYAEGRRFIEVAREDVGVTWERSLDVAASGTPHSFADQLDEYYSMTDGEICSDNPYGQYWGYTIDIKVLACTAPI